MIVIDSGYFYAAVILDNNDVVVRAAPIIKYMRGWTGDRVAAYADKKRWKYKEI